MTRSTTTRDDAGPSPYGRDARTGAVPWRALAVRLFVLVVPAQVVGVLLLGALLAVSGLLRDHPGLSNLISVGAGALAGAAVGALVTPVRERLGSYAAATAVAGLLSFSALTALARLRLSASVPSPAWYTFVLGALLVMAVQTLVAWAVWALRRRAG